jgi:2-dehydro-3-deoxygalactonokinase
MTEHSPNGNFYMKDKYFLSVDWGTSNFRLRMVECDTVRIAEELSAPDGGTRALYDLWKTRGGDRETIFLSFLQEQILRLKSAPPPLTRVVISGMASSSIGLRELPYAPLPFTVDGKSIVVEKIPAGDHCPYELLLISGVSSDRDVIRGEETQLMGCYPEQVHGTGTQVFIFPGTHSKHFLISDGVVFDFKTYMTGEFFELLARKSVLSASVEMDAGMEGPQAIDSFKKGVRAAVNANLLHASFRVRTHSLFHELNNKDNWSYLSGLLIGTELQDLGKTHVSRIYLVSGANLNIPYQMALEELGLDKNLSVFPADWCNEAVVKGQYKILRGL